MVFWEQFTFCCIATKLKGLPSSQSPRLNQELIYAMKLKLKINKTKGNKIIKILTKNVVTKFM